jgi:hypothetical protein
MADIIELILAGHARMGSRPWRPTSSAKMRRPTPYGHVLEKAVQARPVDGRTPQPDHLGGQPGGDRAVTVCRRGEQEAQA